jgi:transglutaminase-like putative cysteine protease
VHLLAFVALTAAAVLTVDRVVQPPMTRTLLLAIALGVLAGLPGYLHERAMPLTVVLLPLGLYVLLRLVLPLPADIETRADEVAFYVGELRSGLHAYAEDVFPLSLDAVSGYELMLGMWMYLLVMLASTFALGARYLVPGVGIMVIILGFTTTVDPDPSAVPTLLFLVCLILALVTSPGGRRRVWHLRDAVGGVGMGAVAIGSALVLLVAFPGLVRPAWTDWKSFDPFAGNASYVYVFNWKQNYARLLDPGNEIPIMRVTSAVPSYWRATTLEYFTGDAWLSLTSFPIPIPEGPGPRPIPQPEPEPPGSEVDQTYELAGTWTNYIFTGGYARTLTLDSTEAVFASDAGALRTETILTSPLRYELTALVPRVSPEDLVGTSFDYPPSLDRGVYLDLPFPDAATQRQIVEAGESGAAPTTTTTLRVTRVGEYEGIYALNDAIVGDAEDPYDVTLRIESYLRDNYNYSLEVPDSRYASPIAAFLFDHRTGYCQHFAGAMALLLRLNGIPSRVAVGFTTGEEVGTWTYLVRSNNAHAWVEAYFAGIGWLTFDSTPGRPLPVAGPSSSSPGFVDPFAARATETDPGQAPESSDASSRLPQDIEMPQEATAQAPSIPWGAVILSLFAMALIAWPFARRWLRERPLRVGDSESRLRASIDLLRGDLAVAGVPVLASSTLDEVAALTDQSLSVDMAPLALRAQLITFGGRSASEDDVVSAERTRSQVSRIAWRRRRLAWLSAWYGVTPLVEWWRSRSQSGSADELPRRRGAKWRLRT